MSLHLVAGQAIRLDRAPFPLRAVGREGTPRRPTLVQTPPQGARVTIARGIEHRFDS